MFGRIGLRAFYVFSCIFLLGWLVACSVGVVFAGGALYRLLTNQGEVKGTAFEWTILLVAPLAFAVIGCLFIHFLQGRLLQFEELLGSTNPFGTREPQPGTQQVKKVGEATPAFNGSGQKWAKVWRGGEPLQLVSKPGESQLRFRQRMEPSTRLFGVVFLAVGIVVFILTSFIAASFEGPRGAAIFVGLVFALVGGVLALGRRGMTIDKPSDQVSTWWGLLIPLWIKSRELSSYSEAQVDEDRRETENGPYFAYRVLSFGPSEKPFPLFASPFRGESEAVAAEITKYIGLGAKSS